MNKLDLKFKLNDVTATHMATLSFVPTGLWLLLLSSSSGTYQNLHAADPLAIVNVLFPSFWILLVSLAFLCFVSIRRHFNMKWLHLLLLSEISLILFFTPFVLSGFSWSPDSLWHGGVANYIPETLSGSKPAFSHYAESYPFSFLTTYIVEEISAINVFSYTLYVYPPIFIVAVTVLAYIFAAKLLEPKQAFISLLLALPAFHFVEPHVSPFSAGTILVLVAFLLLTIKGRTSKSLSLFVILALILTHPISPISLGILLVVVEIFSVLSKKARVRDFIFETSFIASSLLFLGIVWVTWTMYHAMSIYKSIEYSILKVVTLRFLDSLLYASEFTVGGQGFIYSEIHTLNLGVYIVFFLFVSILLIYDLSGRAIKRKTDATLKHLTLKRITIVSASIFYAGFGFLLFLATKERFLLGRGLFFYILLASIGISAFLYAKSQRIKTIKEMSAFTFILFLLISFPIVSYSKEAYNSFTPSADRGLTFITNNVDLTNKSISMGSNQQLAAYANLSENLQILQFYPSSSVHPDFIVLRVNSFFVSAMRYDFSFENNTYTELRDDLNRNMSYNHIYSSSTFEVYSSNED